jgi:ribulose bisphosphate carboxylase small subunit
MLAEIDQCAAANPDAEIKLVGYDSIRQGQVVAFVVRRSG